MPNKIKIVFIGATSMSFGMNTLRDLFSSMRPRSRLLAHSTVRSSSNF